MPVTAVSHTVKENLTSKPSVVGPTRDLIWPLPDWRQLVADGVEDRAAALIKIIRDRIPPRPPISVRQLGTHYTDVRNRDEILVQRDYSRMLELTQARFMACKTVADVKAARAEVLGDAGWRQGTNEPDAQHLVTSIWRSRVDTLTIDYLDLAKAEQMVLSGWPVGPQSSWRRGHVVRRDGQGGFMLAKGMRVLNDGFQTEEQAWRWLQEDSSRKAIAMAQGLPEARSLLRREGLPPHREGRDATTSNLADVFGLARANWMKSEPPAQEARTLNAIYDAMMDLAQTLGLPPRSLGLNNELGLVLGSPESDASGTFYCPKRRSIVLPLTGWDGRLARAWACGFDHWAGRTQSRPAANASGVTPSEGTPPASIEHLSPDEDGAWTKVMAAIWRASPAAAQEVWRLEQEATRLRSAIEGAETQRLAYLRRNPDAEAISAGRMYLDQVGEWLAIRQSALEDLRNRSIAARDLDRRAGPSHYADCLRAAGMTRLLDPQSMFARGFECAVNDALARKGGRNGFLVGGVEEGRVGHDSYLYPKGSERLVIGDACRSVVDAMKQRLAHDEAHDLPASYGRR